MESFSGLGSAVPMANMMTGELVFGGIGSGLSGMLLMVLVAVFLAGLMVGRTPEYLGKKIKGPELKVTVLATVVVPAFTLVAVAVAVATDYGQASLFSSGVLGFSESLYAYVSQAMNNGSAFAGYTGYVQPNAPGNVGAFGITFADLAGGLSMLVGRYVPMLAALAVAGNLVGRTTAPAGAGTLRTDTPSFGVILAGVVVLIALLNYVPALMLGPLAQGFSDRLLY
jgi:potassium-transporting ATPase potassium-binding subunit